MKHLIGLFEIWTGIARSIVAHHYNINLNRVHVPTLPFLLYARKVIRMEQNIPNTSAMYIMVAHHVQGVKRSRPYGHSDMPT